MYGIVQVGPNSGSNKIVEIFATKQDALDNLVVVVARVAIRENFEAGRHTDTPDVADYQIESAKQAQALKEDVARMLPNFEVREI